MYLNSSLAIMANDWKAEEPQKKPKRMEERRNRLLQDMHILGNAESVVFEVNEFKKKVPEKASLLEGHVKTLREIAAAMDYDCKVATLTGLTGSGLSVAGGLMALSGAALAPFTGGASLVASIGMGGSFLGGCTKVAASVKAKWDTEKSKKQVEEILMSCQEELQTLKNSYEGVQKKIQELEGEEMEVDFRTALQKMKLMFTQYEPALMTEAFTLVMRSITLILTAKLLSRVVVEKVSHEFSVAVSRELGKEVAKQMSTAPASYLSFQAIKEFLTFSVREVKWYQNAARTSAVASGAAAAIFLPFDAKDLYREAVHLSKGTKSEIAKEICNTADQLAYLISQLQRG